jgi:hypothetical protein
MGEIFNLITGIRMGFKRQDLAIDPKILNTMSIAEYKRVKKRFCVVLTNF